MSNTQPWPSGDLAVIANQLLWLLEGSFRRLRAHDPSVEPETVRALLAQIRAAGFTVDDETPAQLPPSLALAALAPTFVALAAEVARLRAAGAAVFSAPEDLPRALPCVAHNPRVYRGLPPASLAPHARVELVHMGDMPPRVPDWARRGDVANYPNLRGLWLFNAGLEEAGIDLAALPHLELLDLSQNPLSALPPALAARTSLRYLNLQATRLPHAQVVALRARLPHAFILA